MGAVRRVVRSELRLRLASIVGLALAVALGLGATLAAFIVAERTDRAYPDHVTDARVADLVVNPSFATAQADAVIRGVPHVRRVATSDLMLAGVWDGRPHTLGDLLAGSDPSQIHGSADTRYSQTDRLIVDVGRRPTGRREVFVTESYRRTLDRRIGHAVGVGDRIPIAFLWAGLDVNLTPETAANRVDPIGVERLRISGFGRLADEVIDDPLFPRQELIVSPDVTRRYSCTSRVSQSSDEATILRNVIPETCSLSYRYFALRVNDPANVPTVERLIQRRLTALNSQLPPAMRAIPDGPAYYPVVTTRRDNEAAVQHSVRPSVISLRVFGGVAGLATLVVLLLGAARIMRSGRQADTVIRALGMRRTQRALVLAIPPAIGAALGAAGAIGIGVLLSPIGPVGDVARVSPHRSVAAPLSVVLATVLGFSAAALVCICIAAFAASRLPTERGPASGRRPIRRLIPQLRPAVADGVAAAFGRGRAALLPTAAAVALAALVSATVFGANVSSLVDEPHRYGWPWHIGVLTGFGYGETDTGLVAKTLRDRPEVRSWDELGFANGTVERAPTAVLYGARPPDFVIVQGRGTRRVGEVVLGRETAQRLHIRLGNRIQLVLRDQPQRVRVVGIAVFPSIGPYQSDRAGLGVGAFTLVPSKEMDHHAVTFVGIHLRRGANAASTFASIRSSVTRWDETGSPPYTYVTPIRPAEIVNAEAIQGAPMILAGVLALALLVALALALGATVGTRRRDYAVYRAMGFTDRQVATSVRVHALAAVAVGLVIGIPLGVVGGRWLWRTFAEQIGVAPAPTVPAMLLLLLAVTAVFGALAAAILPARRAVRLRPAEVLRAP